MTQEVYRQIKEHLCSIIRGTEWEGKVYAVGGCVRDSLLGLDPSDIDLTVHMPGGGILFPQWLREQGFTGPQFTTFPFFCTTKFYLKKFPDYEIDCVQTLCKPFPPKNHHSWSRYFGNLREDALCRDFNVNALYENISTRRLEDPTRKGLKDLRNHLLRTPIDPDKSLETSPFSILRGVRFKYQLGMEIEADTWLSMQKHVDRLYEISKSRRQRELLKILALPSRGDILNLLVQMHGFMCFFPGLPRLFEHDMHPVYNGTVWERTLQMFLQFAPGETPFQLAALVHSAFLDGPFNTLSHPTGGPEEIFQYLMLRKKEKSIILSILANAWLVRQWGDGLKNPPRQEIMRFAGNWRRDPAFWQSFLHFVQVDNTICEPGYAMPHLAENLRVFVETPRPRKRPSAAALERKKQRRKYWKARRKAERATQNTIHP